MHVNDRVVLSANAEEGWPREEGVIEEVYVMRKPHGDETFLLVRVDERYREDGRDDGLREVMPDQVERVIQPEEDEEPCEQFGGRGGEV